MGTLLANAPRNTSGSWIKYSIGKGAMKGFGIAVGHSAVGVRNSLDPGVILPAYLVVNAGLHYNLKHFTVAFNINNVTNAVYGTGAYNNVNKWPGAPRNGMINLGYTF